MGRIIKPIFYELLIIVLSIFFSFITEIILFSQYTFLKKNGLSGLNPTIEHFVNWSCMSIIIVLLIAIILVFPVKHIYNLFSSISFATLSLINFILFILVVSKKTSVVNGYWYLFDDPDSMTYGMIVQKKNDCCGWDNISEPLEMVYECAHTVPCETVLRKYYTKRAIPISIFLFISMIIDGLCTFGTYLIMLEHKKQPEQVPEFQERLDSKGL